MKSVRFCGTTGLLLLFPLAGCQMQKKSEQVANLHFETGPAWKSEGIWHYPHMDFSYQDTGLAVIDHRRKAGSVTADGEIYDPQGMTASHPFLQLPAVVVVRNLDNGRYVRIRLNDRGPTHRGRLLSVTPRVASLLGMTNEPARVEVIEDVPASRSFAEDLPGGPRVAIDAAPVGDVKSEVLDRPLGSSGQDAQASSSAGNGVSSSLMQLPVNVMQGYATGGTLWIELGRFTGRQYAALAAQRGGGTVWSATTPGSGRWLALTGPFASVAEADAALDRAVAVGLTGARIVVR